MIKKGLLTLYKLIDKWQRLFPRGINKRLDVGGIILNINQLDSGGVTYEKKTMEVSNRLYELIQKDLKPEIILDIGANYGFVSLVAHKYMPQARVIAVEPDKRVYNYIKKNFRENGIENYDILMCVCGSDIKKTHCFYINPVNSQDNRMKGREGWRTEKTYMVSIDSLLTDNRPVFIKTDTQGYEEEVLRGGRNRLKAKDWILKMEFAPCLLEDNRTNPSRFLRDLIKEYDVVDLSMVQYEVKTLDDLFKNKLCSRNVNDFISYTASLQPNGAGWLDLLVKPPKS